MKRFLRKLTGQSFSLVLIALFTFSAVWVGDRYSAASQSSPMQPASLNLDGAIAQDRHLYPGRVYIPPRRELVGVKEPVEGLTGQQIADKVSRDYPGWTERLPNCPCRQEDIANDKRFVRSSWLARRYQYNVTDYHPGGEYDYRQSQDKIVSYKSPSNPDAPPIRPGQQCIYDAAGALITRGPGAGTPDIFGPEDTPNGSGIHTAWDMKPFHDLVGKSEDQINNNAEGSCLFPLEGVTSKQKSF